MQYEDNVLGFQFSWNKDKPLQLQVLSNETHWRIYENAKRVQTILTNALQHETFNMEDFLGHVGNHCHFVSITCRNEESSFRIFSTINSRGQELSVVDKIKAEMFQQLPESRRSELADRWVACSWDCNSTFAFSYCQDVQSIEGETLLGDACKIACICLIALTIKLLS